MDDFMMDLNPFTVTKPISPARKRLNPSVLLGTSQLADECLRHKVAELGDEDR